MGLPWRPWNAASTARSAVWTGGFMSATVDDRRTAGPQHQRAKGEVTATAGPKRSRRLKAGCRLSGEMSKRQQRGISQKMSVDRRFLPQTTQAAVYVEGGYSQTAGTWSFWYPIAQAKHFGSRPTDREFHPIAAGAPASNLWADLGFGPKPCRRRRSISGNVSPHVAECRTFRIGYRFCRVGTQFRAVLGSQIL